jgi:methanol metabolism-related c-type cytochrome
MGTGAGFRAGTLVTRMVLKKAGPDRWNGTAGSREKHPLNHLSTFVTRPLVAALALATVNLVAVHAEDAKPADPALANSLNPNDKSAEPDEKLLKKDAAVKVEDGKYFDADGHPTFRVTNEGKKVDWYAYSGYRRYHAECHVCHGPDGMGSTYAPALKDSLKRLSYEEFIGILAGGKQEISNTANQVMPAFGDNKNVMCYADDLYVYLKARAAGAMGRIRPNDKEDKPEAAKKAEKECLGG